MHQVFEEMAQHIQQQNDSHKYLDKLQKANERMALQEKDRQVLKKIVHKPMNIL